MIPVSAAPTEPSSWARRFPFWCTPWPCRLWVAGSVGAALVLPLLFRSLDPRHDVDVEVLTGVMVVTLSVLNVEIGRLFEGGMSATQRPHKALSAWSFATALLLPTWWLLAVVAVTYSHARWRGLRVPLWKWIGSAAYIVLAGVAAAATARAVIGTEPNLMQGEGLRGLLAVLVAAAAFLVVETVLFHGSAYLNSADDEAWLRQTLRSPSFYLTETGVLLVGGLSAAIWTGGPWFLVLLVPVYALTQRAALHEPLRERAEHDDKTGVLRFESWRILAVTASGRCFRKQRPWSVIFADLDRFKRFNDTWGHLAGDEALVAVARGIDAELRDDDLLGRFGGEEFCVFLPGVDAAEATKIADRIRTTVAMLDMPETQQVTISLGVASVASTGGDVEFASVLAAADRALFEAKTAGRNATRVQVIEPVPGP